MKKLSLFSLTVLLSMFTYLDTIAQGSGSHGGYTRTAPNNSNAFNRSSAYNPDLAEQSAFEVVKQTKGSLVSVDNQFITLRTKKNKLVKVRLTPDTNYKRKKDDTIYQDLAEGQYVKVFYKPKETALGTDQAVTVRILE